MHSPPSATCTLANPGSACARLPGSEENSQDSRAFDEVTAPQPSRLLGQAVGPFQAELLHPKRCARPLSGQKINRRADTQRHTGFAADLTKRLCDHLLRRAADAQKHDVP